MLHLDQGGKNQLYTWYFGGLLKESPNLDFDVFGLSYYPMWHGTMEGLQYNLNYLATTYNKEVCVVETAYAWTTEDGEGNVFISGDEEVGGYPATVEGQFEFMNDLESIILNVPDDKGIGYFYWEPEWIPVEGGTYATSAGVAYKNDTVTPSNTWDNMTLFNFQGNALDSIKVLNKPCENLLTNISFEQNGITTSPSGWNVWTSDSSDENTVRTEYGDAYGMIKSIRVLYIKRIQIFRMEHINSQFGQRQMGNRMFYNFMQKIMEEVSLIPRLKQVTLIGIFLV